MSTFENHQELEATISLTSCVHAAVLTITTTTTILTLPHNNNKNNKDKNKNNNNNQYCVWFGLPQKSCVLIKKTIMAAF
jgi:hypothetical protein